MSPLRITESDLHPHLKARLEQRVSLEELQQVLEGGWQATDARSGTDGKVYVFLYNREWEGSYYHEKKVTVYYKTTQDNRVILTVKARYGEGFKRGKIT